MSVLKKGDKGLSVRIVQMMLNSTLTPSPNLKEDGELGDKTLEAVQRLQRSFGRTPGASIDPMTLMLLGLKPVVECVRKVLPGAPHWMTIAEAEYGVHENALPGRHNQRIVEYHQATTLAAGTDEVPWCSSFVNWVMKKAGCAGTGSALAASWLTWGKELASGREGAITVIKRKNATSDASTGSSTGNHVGFFVSATQTHLCLLGGNQSDRVKYSDFPLASYNVRGYRWPA